MAAQIPPLLQQTLAALQQVGVSAQLQTKGKQTKPDQCLQLKVEINKKVHTPYAVHLCPALNAATVGAVAVQVQQLTQTTLAPVLVIAKHVPPPVAEQLKTLGVQFADSVGNAYLTGPGLLVWIAGRSKPATAHKTNTQERAFKTAGLKLLFALMCQPDLVKAPYRDMAQAAGVALGVVTPTLEGLRLQGYLAVVGRQRQLHSTRALLHDWALAYARTLRPKTVLRTTTTPLFDTWKNWPLAQHQALWGGEPAGALLTENLQPGKLCIYADQLPARLMVQQKLSTAAPQQTDGLIELRQKFWGDTLQINQTNLATVPPLLVYADLLATGDARCLETAQQIYEAHLARLFP